MRKKISLELKRAFFLLATFAIVVYLFVPKIVLNFIEDVSVAGIEKFDNPPVLKREVEAIEIIRNEEIQPNEEMQITKTKEQDTINISKQEETQTIGSSLDETPRKETGQKELSHRENAELEEARHKRMQSSIEKFTENIKGFDWYK